MRLEMIGAYKLFREVDIYCMAAAGYALLTLPQNKLENQPTPCIE